MSKELTPLEALRELFRLAYGWKTEPTKDYDYYRIIETTLKRLEVYETFGLLDEKYDDVDKLTDIKGKLTYVDRVMDTQERLLASVSSDEIRILSSVLDSQIRKLKKKLKAFDIIKEQEMLSVFEEKGMYYLVFNTIAVEITKDKYDLLKEELE